MTSAHTPTDKDIRAASARFASYNPITGRNAEGKKAPAKLINPKSNKAAADAARRIRQQAERTDDENRALLDRKNALRRARQAARSEEECQQSRDRRNAKRRARWQATHAGIPNQCGPRARERAEKLRAKRGTCANGHPLIAENVGTDRKSHFVCLACRRERQWQVNKMRRRADAMRDAA